MKIRYDIEYPLDSPERTLHHREIILQKKFLRKLYDQWYAEFLCEIPRLPNDTYIELGSGGGFLKELDPKMICSDILDLPSNDLTFSALDMPFSTNSVGGIFMVDTMHHIPDMEKFLEEVSRVLVKNGKMLDFHHFGLNWRDRITITALIVLPESSLGDSTIEENFHPDF